MTKSFMHDVKLIQHKETRLSSKNRAKILAVTS